MSSESAAWLDRVREHYDRDPALEWGRFEARVQHRIEFIVTMHAIERHLPAPGAGARVLDAGGGPGRYTIALAERGYRVTLLDLSPANVEFARDRIAKAGASVAANVEATCAGSFTDLGAFPDASFDAVLCLGAALSHVADASLRLRALAELRRVAKPSAPLLLSVQNALATLRSIVQWPYTWAGDAQGWIDREPANTVKGSDGLPWVEFLPEEFLALLAEAGLECERLYGCWGIAAHLPAENLEALMADEERWPLWRRWLLETCDHPNVIGLSGHLIAHALG